MPGTKKDTYCYNSLASNAAPIEPAYLANGLVCTSLSSLSDNNYTNDPTSHNPPVRNTVSVILCYINMGLQIQYF